MVTTKKKAAGNKSATKSTPKVNPSPTKSKSVSRSKPTSKKPAKSAELRSFAPTGEAVPFFTFRPTMQTIYWLILGALVLTLGFWVIHLNTQVQEIYNQIDANSSSTPLPIKKAAK